MIESLVGRIEAGGQPVAAQAAVIVRRVAIFEPVGKKEVNHFVLRQARTVIGGRGGGEQGEGSGNHAITSWCWIGPNLATNSPWSGICATSWT